MCETWSETRCQNLFYNLLIMVDNVKSSDDYYSDERASFYANIIRKWNDTIYCDKYSRELNDNSDIRKINSYHFDNFTLNLEKFNNSQKRHLASVIDDSKSFYKIRLLKTLNYHNYFYYKLQPLSLIVNYFPFQK